MTVDSRSPTSAVIYPGCRGGRGHFVYRFSRTDPRGRTNLRRRSFAGGNSILTVFEERLVPQARRTRCPIGPWSSRRWTLRLVANARRVFTQEALVNVERREDPENAGTEKQLTGVQPRQARSFECLMRPRKPVEEEKEQRCHDAALPSSALAGAMFTGSFDTNEEVDTATIITKTTSSTLQICLSWHEFYQPVILSPSKSRHLRSPCRIHKG